MSDFFKEIAKGIGFKLIDNFSDKVSEWIKEVFENIQENDSDNIATSGDYSQVATSGDNSKVATSGDWSKIATSGYGSQVATSGDRSKVVTSGYGSQVATSGDYSQVATSGNWSQVATSGDWSKIATSGNESKVATSGRWSQVATSGNESQVAASGYGSKIATSGNESKVATSGRWSQVATSGDESQVAASGYGSKVATSGNFSQIEINGNNSVGFACGYNSIIKAKQGTWISLCEYGKDEEKNIIPIYVLSGQIGNKDYKDFKNKILKENEFYCLYNKKFHKVDISDGLEIVELSTHKRDGITIMKGFDLDYILEEDKKEIYLAKEGKLSAHGYSLREAIDDLTYKKMKNINVDEIVSEIKKTGKVTRSQYRAITGACSYGTNKFCEEHNIEDLEEIELDELRKILVNDYGAEKFWKLIDGE